MGKQNKVSLSWFLVVFLDDLSFVIENRPKSNIIWQNDFLEDFNLVEIWTTMFQKTVKYIHT